MLNEVIKGIANAINGKVEVQDEILRLDDGAVNIGFPIEKINNSINEIGVEGTINMLLNTLRAACKSKDRLNEMMNDYSKMKDNIILCVRQPQNDNVLTMPYLDMELYIRGIVSEDSEGTQTFKITKDYLNKLNVSPKEIFEHAKENIESSYSVKSLLSSIGLKEQDGVDDYGANVVMSTKLNYFGAGIIASEKILKYIYSRLGEFYVLPSSIHEIIVIPSKVLNKEDALNMVKSVNAECVSDKDKLIDNCYIYDGESLIQC